MTRALVTTGKPAEVLAKELLGPAPATDVVRLDNEIMKMGYDLGRGDEQTMRSMMCCPNAVSMRRDLNQRTDQYEHRCEQCGTFLFAINRMSEAQRRARK